MKYVSIRSAKWGCLQVQMLFKTEKEVPVLFSANCHFLMERSSFTIEYNVSFTNKTVTEIQMSCDFAQQNFLQTHKHYQKICL